MDDGVDTAGVDLFPLLLAQQKDPALRSLTVTVAVMNVGLLLGWVVGIVTASSDDVTMVLAGGLGLVVVSLMFSFGWFYMLRSRYGLGFYLLGQEMASKEEEEEEVPEDTGLEEDEDMDLTMLPGQTEPDEEELRQRELERMQNSDGPSKEDIENAESRIRQVMEDGQSEEIGRIVHRYVHLITVIQPDLLWAAELLQVRLSTANKAIERAREQAKALDAATVLGSALPEFTEKESKNYLTAPGGRPLSTGGMLRGTTDGRDALADAIDKAILELHDLDSEGLSPKQADSLAAPPGSVLLREQETEKKDLMTQLEGLKAAVEQLAVYRLKQKDELHIAAKASIYQEAPVSVRAAAFLSDSEGQATAACAALHTAISNSTSEKYIKRIADLGDATKLCELIILQLENFLGVSAYAARFATMATTSGDKKDENMLTYFATGPSERGIMHHVLPRDRCVLSYGAATMRKTLHITGIQSAKPKVYFWFGSAGKKSGHLVLMPIALSASDPVLGVLVIDTINKTRKNNRICGVTREEKGVVEFAATQMARCLARARDAQSELQSAILEAMNREPEGHPGRVLQHLELLRLKTRLDAILLEGSPEARACFLEFRTTNKPPRDMIALGCAICMLIRPADTLAKVEGYFGAKVMPGSQEACMPFWLEYVQKVLVDFGENLLLALHAVEYRNPTVELNQFYHAAAVLNTVSAYQTRFTVMTFVLPWLKCLLALNQLLVPSSAPQGASIAWGGDGATTRALEMSQTQEGLVMPPADAGGEQMERAQLESGGTEEPADTSLV